MRNTVQTATAPSHWASFLINGDASGFDPQERNAALDWLVRMDIGNPVSCEDAGFLCSHDAWKESPLAADCQTYSFIVPVKESSEPIRESPVTRSGLWTLKRIRLNAGGYTSQGHYYGQGLPLYWACSPDSQTDRYFRAASRAAAKAIVRAEFPDARFYR